MKLKHIFAALLGVIAITACSDDDNIGNLGVVSLDKTYVTIPADGGSASVTLKANNDWAFNNTFQVITRNPDRTRDTTYHPTPTWLTVDKTTGAAGETQLTFTAQASAGGREAQLSINCGGQTQYLQVRQGSMEATNATCAEVIAGPDGKTFRVTGTVEGIYNTTYGNYLLRDNSGVITIYGTLDRNGATRNFASLGIENGDVITVEGPKTTYGTTIELVDVTVIKITKALIKLESEATEKVATTGGDFTVKVSYKGGSVTPSVSDEAKSWLGVTDIKVNKGVATKTVSNPADTALITVHAQPNTGSERTGVLTFKSGSSTATVSVTQDGQAAQPGTEALPYTVEQAIAFTNTVTGTSADKVYITGIVSQIARNGEFGANYGNASFYISDDGQYHDDKAKDFEAFRVLYLGNRKWVEGDKQIKVGDKVTICGNVTMYNGTAETAGNQGYLVSLNGATE